MQGSLIYQHESRDLVPLLEMLTEAARAGDWCGLDVHIEVWLREPGDVDAEAYTASVHFNYNAQGGVA